MYHFQRSRGSHKFMTTKEEKNEVAEQNGIGSIKVERKNQ